MTPPIGSATGPGTPHYSGIDTNEGTVVTRPQDQPPPTEAQTSGATSTAKSNLPPAPIGDPIAAGALKAQLNTQVGDSKGTKNLAPDEQAVKSLYGEQGLNCYRKMKEVTSAVLADQLKQAGSNQQAQGNLVTDVLRGIQTQISALQTLEQLQQKSLDKIQTL